MQRRYLFLLLSLTLLFALATYLTPASSAVLHKYHISTAQLRIVDTLIILPLAGIWTAAFYGASTFDRYARTIQRHRDGAALRVMSYGISILAIGTSTVSIITTLIGTYSSRHLGAVRAQVVIGNYLTLFVTMAAFAFIYKGASQLAQLTGKKFYASGHLIYNSVYIGLAVLYTYLFLNRLPSASHVPLTATSHAAYYTPTPILVLTFLIPYLISWYLGSLSIYMLRFYRQNIGGKLYTHDLAFLSAGLGIVVTGSIVVQILTTLTGQLQNLSTAAIIALVYCLLAIIAAGYVPIAVGAKKLATLEKI
jgi:hypothetical protein